MSNKKLEYNPLFESLVGTARRYERIKEQENTESGDYKVKNAKEYALKIVQILYDEYLYFLNSIPDEDERKKYKSELLSFIESESKKTDTNMELLAKSMIAKFQEINKSSSVTKASEKSETIKNAYSKVEQGISNFMELVKLYNEKYAKEIADPSVANGIKEFMTNASANLQKA
jgi:hypothetical protein